MSQTEVVEKIRHFVFSNFYSKICEIMWKNSVERGRPQVAIRHIVC